MAGTPRRFWYGMEKAAFLSMLDKILVGMNADGSAKYADINQLLSLLQVATNGNFFGAASTSDSPSPADGDGFWIVSEAGTYPNFGGVVLAANQFGFISRKGGSYSIISTTFDLSGYALKGGAVAPGSADSVAGSDIYAVVRPASEAVGKLSAPFHTHDNLFIWFNGFPDNNANYEIRQYSVEAGKTYLLEIQLTSPSVGGGGIGVYGFYGTDDFSSLIGGTLLLQPPDLTKAYFLPLIAPATATILNVTVHKSTGYCELREYISLGDVADGLAETTDRATVNETDIANLAGAVFSNVVGVALDSVIDGQYLNSAGTGNIDGGYELRAFAVSPNGYYRVSGQLTAATDPGPATSVGRYGFYTSASDLGTLISGSLVTQPEGTTQTYADTVKAPATANFMQVAVKKAADIVAVDGLANVSGLVARFPDVVSCWGDSITWGAAPEDNMPWVARLQTLFGPRLRVVNCGVGGEGMRQVAARQGGAAMYNSQQFTLPANPANSVQVGAWSGWAYDGFFKSAKDNGPVALLLQGEQGRDTGFKTVNPCYVSGIECTLEINISSWEPLTATYSLRRNQIGLANRTIPTGTPVFTNAAKNMKQAATVLWFGTNDGFGGGVVDVPELIDWYRRCIAYAGISRYVVVGIYGGTGISGMSLGQIEDMEATMLAAFGLHYWNVRRYAITNALADAGITPTGGDTAAIAAGQCPPSLLADEVHPNAAFSQLIAARLYEILTQMGV